MTDELKPLKFGQFIRVRKDMPEFKAGMDGMVMEDSVDENVVLFFKYNRYGEEEGAVCVGPELWKRHELDMDSLD